MWKTRWVCGAAVALGLGCSAETTSTDAMIGEFEEAISALESDTGEGLDSVAEDASFDPEAMREARREGRKHRGRRGPVVDRVDPEAIAACREMAEACKMGEDTECRDDVRACVQAALEDAFDALCEDKTAECADAEADSERCDRIATKCEEGLQRPPCLRDRPRGDKPEGDKPEGDKPEGDRPPRDGRPTPDEEPMPPEPEPEDQPQDLG